MHLREIVLEGFMLSEHHTFTGETRLALPDSGIITILGENGAGKSRLVEAVSVAGWGKMLRGTQPWREDVHGRACFRLADVTVTRSKRGKKTDLVIQKDGEEPMAFATVTKAQEALERIIGSFEVWSRTHVFSSADAAHFSIATDGERKRLLEAVLGLGMFDPALELCRERGRPVKERLTSLRQKLDLSRGLLEAEKRREQEARQALEAGAVGQVAEDALAAVAGGKLEELGRMISQANTDIQGLYERVRQVESAAAVAESEERGARQRWNLLQSGKCPTCGQAIPQAQQDTLRAAVEAAQAAAQQARATVDTTKEQARADLRELKEESDGLNAKRTTLSSRAAAAKEASKAREAMEKVLATAEAKTAEHEKVIKEAEEALATVEADLKVWTAVEQVLGLRGVRAGLLGRTLGGLEAAANAHLARISEGGLTLRLAPYTEKKGGGVSDSIAIQVKGAGGDQGYRAASQGERRRLDFALLLALAEVSAASRGATPGTLFFDEVFDSLDRAGVEAVAASLESLAKNRVVVVITHSPDVEKRLPGRHLLVEAGKVTVH